MKEKRTERKKILFRSNANGHNIKGTKENLSSQPCFSKAAVLPHPEWRNLYNRVWDVADYVVPPAENGAVFVTTNVIITPNQGRRNYSQI
jgi:hypothetical protein